MVNKSRSIRRTVRFYEKEIELINKDMKKKKIGNYSEYFRPKIMEGLSTGKVA